MTGQELKDLRQKRKLTRYKLASKVGVTEGTLRRWEHGFSSPSRENKVRLYRILGLGDPFRSRKSAGQREWEKKQRVAALKRIDAKVDDWRDLDDDDPDLLALRRLVEG